MELATDPCGGEGATEAAELIISEV
ncbi:unnamed protein product [Linum tenue]|uniref:Uncharacterized protein n=1 Tax=Linum tenue TaxID=586396 RepID=A0AAV0I4F4_9ROSI|nr:unnamed protein product [Linum tenue]